MDDLSGGEKARLVLAELLQSRPNFLILDEPTNHMDIQAKETLESAFQAYEGTILLYPMTGILSVRWQSPCSFLKITLLFIILWI